MNGISLLLPDYQTLLKFVIYCVAIKPFFRLAIAHDFLIQN